MRNCPAPILVDTAEQLARSAPDWHRAKVLALDTEFVRTDTFYPRLGLLQFSDGEQCWLVDPLQGLDLEPVRQVLVNPAIVKLFHSCSEDLEVLSLAFGELPRPLVDTQVAAAFAGLGFSRGYHAMIKQLFQVELGKEETRSDWLQRPLTGRQCVYAAEDVHYLYHAYHAIAAMLENKGVMPWLIEDMNLLLQEAATPLEPADYYRRLKSAWRLTAPQLTLLGKLCEWREREARHRDKPRGFIIKDDQLLTIAQMAPADRSGLESLGLHPGLLRRYGEILLHIIAACRQIPEDSLLKPLPKPLGKEFAPIVKQVKAKLDEIAQNNHLPKELLASRRDIEQFVFHGVDPDVPLPGRYTRGWRRALVAEPVMALIQEYTEVKA